MVTGMRFIRIVGLVSAVLVALVTGSGQALAGVCPATGIAPTVTAVSPSSGPNGGGTALIITGTQFSDDTPPTVNIGGSRLALRASRM